MYAKLGVNTSELPSSRAQIPRFREISLEEMSHPNYIDPVYLQYSGNNPVRTFNKHPNEMANYERGRQLAMNKCANRVKYQKEIEEYNRMPGAQRPTRFTLNQERHDRLSQTTTTFRPTDPNIRVCPTGYVGTHDAHGFLCMKVNIPESGLYKESLHEDEFGGYQKLKPTGKFFI